MTARTRLLILCFALIGLGFSSWAGYVHYRLLTQPNYISPCDINATFNCSELYLSQYGSIGGVSVALLGALFFLVVASIAALSQTVTNKSEQAGATYVFAMSTIGLAMVLYLAWASYFVLHKFCPLCIGAYASTVALFIVSGISGSFPVSRLPGRLGTDVSDLFRKPDRLFAALLCVVVAVSMVGCFPREGSAPAAVTSAPPANGAAPSGQQASFDALWAAQPRIDLGVPADGAKVVVVKFNDWQCPSCKAAHELYKSLFAKYEQQMPGAVKYVIKDYPLNPKCNFSAPGGQHPGACEAAAAVRLATEKGKHDEMVDWLFANQSTLTPQSVEAQAKTMLGINDFPAQYARVLPAIKSDVADGAAVKIMFTPTFYVNGIKAATPDGRILTAEYFDYAIQYEIKKAGGGK